MNNPYKTGKLTEEPAPEFQVAAERSFRRPEVKPIVEDKSKDSKYTSIGLPSNFFFYTFDTLNIRPFELSELKKVWRAYTLKEFQGIVEAINACIDQDALSLTEDDFRFLMYWQRRNSYKTSSYSVPLECSNAQHIQDIREQKMAPETIMTNVLVKASETVVKELETASVGKFVEQAYSDFGIYFYPTTIRDIVTAMENDNIAAEDDFMMKYASVVSPVHGVTLKDRMDFLEAQHLSPDFMSRAEEFTELSAHGVTEMTTFKCDGCGTEQRTEIRVSAMTFFPHLFGRKSDR